MTYPKRHNMTMLDLARLGVYLDEYTEKFRGTRYDEDTMDLKAYHAAYRIIHGSSSRKDEDLVRQHYYDTVKDQCFTKRGELGSMFKREVFMTAEERAQYYQNAIDRMEEKRDRKLFLELKQKYGW